jgi:hypothetical protein
LCSPCTACSVRFTALNRCMRTPLPDVKLQQCTRGFTHVQPHHTGTPMCMLLLGGTLPCCLACCSSPCSLMASRTCAAQRARLQVEDLVFGRCCTTERAPLMPDTIGHSRCRLPLSVTMTAMYRQNVQHFQPHLTGIDTIDLIRVGSHQAMT